MGRARVWIIAAIIVALLLYIKRGYILTTAKGIKDKALRTIASFEGFAEHPYPDAQGASVGFGHFIKPGEKFIFPMDENTAYSLLEKDAATARDAIARLVTVPLSENQKTALISLVYNIGEGNFSRSTLLKKLNAGDYRGAADQFGVWRKSQGIVLASLVDRREKEKQIFLA